ncbi:MAG TPA: peroxiredoxin [Planctomycetota bacterium]|nr:peroxiredoxin [Planctomycetota bacterium]
MKALLSLTLLGTLALQDKVDLKVGDAAPSFSAKDDTGADWKSGDHVGKKILVVYFYPASFTSGCTKQACAYRDDQKALNDAGAEVIGVSGDEVKNQEAFKKFHKLNFTLLADDKGDVAKAFGVETKKGGSVKQKIDDKDEEFTRGVTEMRWTFVIDKAGKIAYKNTKVIAPEDPKTVLEVISKLK